MSPEVLIVDDDLAMGEMLRGRLVRRGWSAEARTSAAEALLFLAGEHKPDVIITDIDMPGMSGLELCRRVRATGSLIPIVVITSFGTFDTALQALRAGASDFVTKPFDVDTLVQAIERAAGRLSPTAAGAPRVTEMIAALPEGDGLESVERLVSAGRNARGLIHDLGTPLNVVLGHAQLLASEDLTPTEVRASARAIVEQAHRITALIRQGLAAGETQAGRVTSRLDDVVAAAIAHVTPLAEQRGIEIIVDRVASLVALDVQANRLQHVFEHLLTNGLQAMGGGGRLCVRLERSCSPLRDGTSTDMHSITVEDTGCGIPPAHLDKLFHSFFTTKRESGGAGLGLMVCHHIVRAHGGTIAVDSTPGQGSRFVVRLPVSLAASGAEPAEPAHA